MFTGIVEAIGTVRSATPYKGDLRLQINTGSLDLSDVQLGDSISTNGVCLTVVELSDNGFVADVSLETLEHTTIGQLTTGSQVNLEKALTPMTRLGGHLVSGHVDGIGKIVTVEPSARSIRYWIEAPRSLARYIAHKGSITIDGISLTVNAVEGLKFAINIVPHTQQKTNSSQWQISDDVNLEVDLIARYLERLCDPELRETGDDKPAITANFLAEHGFMR